MFRLFIFTLVALTHTTSATMLRIKPSGAPTTTHRIAIHRENLVKIEPTAKPCFRTIESQPKSEIASPHLERHEASSIDPLDVLMATKELSAKYDWQSKLLSLGVPYDPKWETMSSSQLQLLHRVHKTLLEMEEKLSSL